MAQYIDAFGEWLNDSVLREHVRAFLRSQNFISPTIQSLHIVSFSVVLGTAGVIALRLLGLGAKGQDPQEMARRLYPWMWTALVILLLTGSMLFLNRPTRYLHNVSFQSKVFMLLAAVGLTAVLQWGLARGNDYWSAPARRPIGRAIAGVSLVLWVAIILAGRLIAYVPF